MGREVGEGTGRDGKGGMTVIHIVIGMFTSNPMIPQYLNNTTRYLSNSTFNNLT